MVTHTKVNGFPKVNNTKVNSTREIRYRGALGHTPNIIPRSIIHTWLVSARNAKMNNSRGLASIISLLLLVLFRRSSTALFCQCLIQQRIRKRRLRLRFINASAHSIYYLTARWNNCECVRAPRSVWVLPHPQMWFQQLLYGVPCPPKFNFWILLVFLAFDVVVYNLYLHLQLNISLLQLSIWHCLFHDSTL